MAAVSPQARCEVVRAVTVHDVVIADVRGAPGAALPAGAAGDGDQVLVYFLRRGSWRFTATAGSAAVTAAAGSFTARRGHLPPPACAGPGAAATVLVVPGHALASLLERRQSVGPARSAEARVLLACADMAGRTAGGLSAAGALGARDALLELVRGAVAKELRAAAPAAPAALAAAARQLADARLADPGLSPSSLARDLAVSVRTLHRSFAAEGGQVAAYIRARRLQRARADLAGLTGRPDISAVAARWCFADNSHFTRSFRKQYGQTPSQFARSGARARAAAGATAPVRDLSAGPALAEAVTTSSAASVTT